MCIQLFDQCNLGFCWNLYIEIVLFAFTFDYTFDGRKKVDLAKLIRRLKRESEKVGLYFNIKKTKIMTTTHWSSFEIDGEEIQVVSSFTFLGSEVEKEGRCDKEIKRRVAIGKATMIGLEKLWHRHKKG